MLRLKKVKPIGCQVLVTKNLYGWDDFMEGGILVHKRGDLKTYQEVIAVGDDVKFVKPGDTVEINFYKYAVFKEDTNSVKAMHDNSIVELRLNEVELTDRERQILQFIAQGKTSPQIAEKMYLSLPTIKWYRKKLLVKFEASNTADLVFKAKEKGLI